MNVENINNPEFLKSMSIDELKEVSKDIRKFLIKSISKTGGHFSSNLGIVELTVAMHYVFDSPKDKFIFDVGHQSYVHKILTGRAKQMRHMRQLGGISGFQKRNESEHDPWEAGHSSTALSGATGMAIARDLDNKDYEIVCVVGDAAMMSGETLEALNYLGSLDTKVIVILNDNNMSISRNVGGFSNFLSNIRVSKEYGEARDNYRRVMMRSQSGKRFFKVTKKFKDAVIDQIFPENLFDQFGLDYVGPIDGHDMKELVNALKAVKRMDHSVVLHVETIKGKGYPAAEHDHEGLYHGVEPFDPEKGIVRKKSANERQWCHAVAHYLNSMMDVHHDICVITPAMIAGSSLRQLFKSYPDRCFDVGIAEEHAMTFTAGLSMAGKFPFLSIYSSFSQRAYDQLNHDIARMNLPCLIGIDRAGLVGKDGPTHHGVFDLGIMMPIPHLVIMTPHNQQEMEAMVNTAYKKRNAPYIMRYSKKSIPINVLHAKYTLKVGSWEKINFDDNYKITVITYGDNVNHVAKMIEEDHLPINLINARFLKPMDHTMLNELINQKIIIYETDMSTGGLGQQIAYYYTRKHLNVDMTFMGIRDHYVTQGTVEQLLDLEGLSINDLKDTIKELM